MSMFDKIKSMLGGHEDTVRHGVDKTGDAVDDKTQGKYSGQVDAAQKKADEQLGHQMPPSEPPQN